MPVLWPAGIWEAPHRPLFLLAGLWALLVPGVWLLPVGAGPSPLEWHRHELLYGMGGAAVGGYLLTALPAWTGQPKLSPPVTCIVVALWIAGRLAFALDWPPPLGPAVSLLYFAALGLILVRGILRAGAWRRLPLALAPFMLGLSGIVDAELARGIGSAPVRELSPLLFALLIGVVGGRAIPAFTRHWAARGAQDSAVTDPPLLAGISILLLASAILLLSAGADRPAGLTLILSGGLQGARVVFWRSWSTWRYPALAVLHLAWLWLPAGLILLGISHLSSSALAPAAALHALTMGAMGSMMLAIMGRAAMVRRGPALDVSRSFGLGFLLVFLSTVPRLAMAGIDSEAYLDLLLRLAACCWMAGWAMFLWDFRHALRGPVQRPVLSARTHPSPL